MDQETWRPLGPRARALSSSHQCSLWSKRCIRPLGPPCVCTRAVTPEEALKALVTPALEQWRAERAIASAVPGGSVGLAPIAG
jgi:hypothetical protein